MNLLSIKTFFITYFFLFSAGTSLYSREVSFQVYTRSIYSPGEKVQLHLNAYYTKNKENFTFTIYRIKDVEGFFSRQALNNHLDVLGKDTLNLLYFCKEVNSFERNLSVRNNNYIQEIIEYKPDSKGAYLVKVSCRNRVAYTGFFVTQLGIITNVTSDAILTYIVDRYSGEQINEAELSFYLSMQKIGIGKTQNGLFLKSLDENDRKYIIEHNVEHPLIIANVDDDVAVSNPYLYFGFANQGYNVYIYTSQPVYRPGMKVYFRGTVRELKNEDYENFPDEELTVKITDPSGSEVYKQVLRTNFNGTFSGEYELTKEASTGIYYITVELDDRNSYYGSFQVEEYKKPEFKVDISPDRDQYGNKDIIKGIITADYYFGSPVQDAVVEYSVFKKEYYRPWWYFSDYRSWYEEYYSNLDDNYKYSGSELIYTGNGKLDNQGRFNFEYLIHEDFKGKRRYWWDLEQNETDFMYIIQAKITDKSRREISSSKTVFVTRADFILSSRTDKYLYTPGETVETEINSRDFSDKPLETEFYAEVFRVLWEYPEYKEKREFVTRLKGKTDLNGKGIVRFKVEEEGYYLVKVSSRDDRGNEVTDKTYFYVSGGNMSWWYNQSGTIQIIPDKDSYNPGEVCRAMIIASNPGVNMLITTQKDNLLSYRVERLTEASKLIEIPIEDKYSPNFSITVSYVKGGKFYTATRSVMVIPEKKFLTLNIGSDKTVYKPGESASLVIQVTDNEGNAVKNAELSLGVIDKSIYAIKSDNTKDPGKFFYSPKWYSTLNYYNENLTYYGYSRLITIYEKYNMKFLTASELGTVRGQVLDKSNNGVSSADIVIDDEYLATTSGEDGRFEFRLPEGKYKISVIQGNNDKEVKKIITVKKGSVTELKLYITKYAGVTRDNLMYGRNGINNESLPDVMTKAFNDSEEKNLSVGENVFQDANIRSDFRDAAYWSPSIFTDDKGYAYVNMIFPDNLTEWVITSRVVTEDTKVGHNIKSVITRKELLIRVETPRFFQQGDEVIISTIIHNYLKSDKSTLVTLEAENLKIDNPNQKNVVIPSNSEVRIDWKARVTEPVGFAKIQAKALTDAESDAVELKIPLQPHGLQLTSYNIMDVSETYKTETGNLVIPEFTDLRSASLVLSVAPSLASTILASLDGLVGYPYGCVEQTMSRFLPTVVVAVSFHDLGAPLSEATKRDLPKMVEAGYKRLYSMQNYEGGWGWWTNDKSDPFMTAYVIYGFTLADRAGYPVKRDVYLAGINSLKKQLEDKNIDAETRAYVLYTLSHTEGIDRKLFQDQYEIISNSELNDYILALLSVAFSNIGDNEKANKFSERLLKSVKYLGESGAYWGNDKVYHRWQDDAVQITAMAIKAMICQPMSLKDNPDLLDKAVRWLLMQRKGRGWVNTKTTATAIYTLVDYLQNSKELDPDFNIKLFLNDEMIVERKFTKEDIFEKDMTFIVDGKKLKIGNNIIKVEKSGRGKLYLSSDLRYYTSDYKIHPIENGFRVEKEYYLLEKYKKYEKDEIIYRKRYFNGEVKSGDEILVKIRVSSKDETNQYFMLVDPIPAGCDVIKDDWAYKIEDERDYQGWNYYWWRWWYADKEIRDNRVTFFASNLYSDTYEFSYIIRAEVPGVYNVMPATGSLMYYPDVRGSSGEISIKITD